ncbi:MAG: hypothetical protein ABI627_17665 [Polyangiaceae bacterium]
MKSRHFKLKWLGLSLSAALLVLSVPRLLFRHEVASRCIRLHSDAELPRETAQVLRSAEQRLRRSPLFDTRRVFDVYLCGSRWRWQLYSGFNGAAAANARWFLFHDVIVRGADIANNRYLQARGNWAPGERTLDYLLAHEITHLLAADFLGATAYRRRPSWLVEGYADYVGRGAGFDFAAARTSWISGKAVAGHPSGNYLGYTLLVAQLLEREGWSVQTLLLRPPDARSVVRRVRWPTAPSASSAQPGRL